MYKTFFLGNAASIAAVNAASKAASAAAQMWSAQMAKVIFAACIIWCAAAGYVGAQTTVTLRTGSGGDTPAGQLQTAIHNALSQAGTTEVIVTSSQQSFAIPAISLVIPNGKTVRWQANTFGSVSGLLLTIGEEATAATHSGDFILESGGIVNLSYSSSAGGVLLNTGNIVVKGGTVQTEGALPAIETKSQNGGIIVEGGTIRLAGSGNAANPVIIVNSGSALLHSGGVIVISKTMDNATPLHVTLQANADYIRTG